MMSSWHVGITAPSRNSHAKTSQNYLLGGRLNRQRTLHVEFRQIGVTERDGVLSEPLAKRLGKVSLMV
jgi:hypothetical protein